jgi:DNA-binding transcriptional LysR family regulator
MQLESVKLDYLKVFCDVARHRSFSQAAAVNGISQSAASQTVRHLEGRLGVELIDRSTRPLQLTAQGRTYYEGCQRLLEQYGELEAAVRDAHAELAANVRVAAIYSVGLRDMSQYVRRFEAKQPGARVYLEYLHPDRVYAEVLAGDADFGLVSFPRKSRDLATLPWREEEMVLACSPRHPLAQNLAVLPAQLHGQKYVAFAKGLVIRREVDRFLRRLGVAVTVACEFDNIENIKKAIEIEGVALLPEPTLRREVQAGTLVVLPLAGARLVRPLGIIHRRHHPPSATARKFMDLLRQPDEAGAAPPHEPETSRNGAARPADHDAHGRNGAPRASSRKKKV